MFTWYFRWQSPMLEEAGAWHTSDLAFCFDNTARCAQGTGNTPEAQQIAKKMAISLKKSKLRAKGVNYFLADGAEAGQDVFHVHLHIIPRYRGDGFYMHMPPKYENETSTEDLERIAAKIGSQSKDW